MRIAALSERQNIIIDARKIIATMKKPSAVYFEDGPLGHHYYQHRDSGKLYTGNTTIAGAWKKDFLQAWYAKEAVKVLGYFDAAYDKEFKGLSVEARKAKIDEAWAKLSQIQKLIAGYPPEKFLKTLETAKGAAKRLSKAATEHGSAAHSQMQSYVEHQLNPALPIKEAELSTEAKNAYNSFLRYVQGKDIIWLASEELVCSDEYMVAGTLDGLAIINGKIFLVDFKTSSQLSEDYILQTGGYDIMLREMGLTVDGYLIIRTPKDGADAETLTIEDVHVMQFARETFIHLREAHRFFVFAESKLKSGEGYDRKIKVDEKVGEVINQNN